MITEIQSAADFLLNIIRTHSDGGSGKSRLNEEQLKAFHAAVSDCLTQQYENHWFPETPLKGSGYRCIRINGTFDPVIAKAGIATGMPPRTLSQMFPTELTMWVNPAEVSYRIGENGSICVLYEDLSLDHLNATMPCPVPTTEKDYYNRRASWPVTDCTNWSSSPVSSNLNSSFYDSLTSVEGEHLDVTEPWTEPSLEGDYFSTTEPSYEVEYLTGSETSWLKSNTTEPSLDGEYFSTTESGYDMDYLTGSETSWVQSSWASIVQATATQIIGDC